MKVVNVIVGVVQKCVTVFVTRGSWAGRERIRDKSVNVIVARDRGILDKVDVRENICRGQRYVPRRSRVLISSWLPRKETKSSLPRS